MNCVSNPLLSLGLLRINWLLIFSPRPSQKSMERSVSQQAAALVTSLKRHVKELSTLHDTELLDVLAGQRVVGKQKVLALLCEKTWSDSTKSPVSLLLAERRDQRRREVASNATVREKDENLRRFNVAFRDAVFSHLLSLDQIPLLRKRDLDKLDIYESKADIVKVVSLLMDKIKVSNSRD